MSVSLQSSYESLYNQVQQQLSIGELEEALEALRRSVGRLEKVKPTTLRFRPELKERLEEQADLLADLEARAGNYETSIALLERQIGRKPAETAAYVSEIARVEIARGNVDQGLADLRDLADAEPTPRQQFLLADALLELRRYAEAREIVEPMSKQAAQDSDDLNVPLGAWLRLFQIAEELKQPREAIAAWRGVRNEDDGTASLLLWRLVALLAQSHDVERAREYLGYVKSWHLSQFLRGCIEQGSGDKEAARLLWDKATERDPESAQDVEAVTRTLLARKDSARAFNVMAFLFVNAAHTWVTELLAGVSGAQRGDDQEATDWLKRSLVHHKEVSLIRKLPIHEWRLWAPTIEDEAMKQQAAAYFDSEF